MDPRLLVVSVENKVEMPSKAYVLLAQRLVLKAISDTRSLEISFVQCPDVSASFGIVSSDEVPELSNLNQVSVLGHPAWIYTKVNKWAEILIPRMAMTSYDKTRIEPLSSQAGALIRAGMSRPMAEKLLSQHSLDELKYEALIVQEALAAKKTIRSVTALFTRRKDIQSVVDAQVEDTTADAPVRISVTEMLRNT